MPEFSPPYALPAPPAGLVGRAEQLDWLRSAAAPAETRVLGLSGPAGVGKTALAIAAAHQLAEAYPDGQLFIDLDDLGPAPTPAEVMALVMWAFQPSTPVAEDAAQLAKTYRGALKDQRVLLVIDSTPSQPHWATLLPPAGRLLLVGDQRLPAQAELALGVLPEADAVRLLLSLAPRIGPNAGELARLCGGFPLALRLAAAALSASSDLVTGGYLRRLIEERGVADAPNAALAALAVNAQLVPAEAGQLWRYLPIFPASFDAAAAAMVAGVKLERAQSSLRDLLSYGLVQRDRVAGRYRLPGLARQYAAPLLDPAEREPARQRHAVYYRDVLAAADQFAAGDRPAVTDRLLAGNGNAQRGLADGLRTFDLEHGNILAGHAWAAARVEANPVATRLASDYAAAGARLLPFRQLPAQRLHWLETAQAAAQQLGDRVAEGRHLDRLGRFYRRAANPRRAITVYERQLRLAREGGDRQGEGEALGRLGLAYADLGLAQRALEYNRQALDVARELANRRAEALASWNLGLAFEQLGDLPSAIAAMQLCLDYEVEINHPDAAADAAQVEELRRRLAG